MIAIYSKILVTTPRFYLEARQHEQWLGRVLVECESGVNGGSWCLFLKILIPPSLPEPLCGGMGGGSR